VDGETVFLSGEIDRASPRDLVASFIEIVHNMALSERLAAVRVDVTELLLLHSSAIKEFLSWILRRNRVPREKKYKLHFFFDPAVTWQATTLAQLRDLDPEGIVLTPTRLPRQIALQAVR